jgi:hypothetical protein
MESLKNRQYFLGYCLTEYGLPILAEYKHQDQILVNDLDNCFMKIFLTGRLINKIFGEYL